MSNSSSNLDETMKSTDAEKVFGNIAPLFASLTDEVLFNQVWQRPQLTPRERSLITVAALTAMYRTEQQTFHLKKAIENGLSVEELAEAITHLAFYAGWPCAASGLESLKKHIETEQQKQTEEGK
ncbi:carboxymuconolactone decarboxylase family protein [Marinomonas rhizomae]|uniref:4-carboxymuconolactone decarboxylase n=1 Tax=Marinomonas rhizomae TaxID=491948 RepID=A0A366JDQ8_9GAMM|nr:carboxymuconolactone decarboxylase family protein [Marinomonas rhizomae]RBP85131.1 4-carboxymuconolactone decarboxylase [Marinomonas rhizomae]